MEWTKRCLRNRRLLGWEGQCQRVLLTDVRRQGCSAVVSEGKGSCHFPLICCKGNFMTCAMYHNSIGK